MLVFSLVSAVLGVLASVLAIAPMNVPVDFPATMPEASGIVWVPSLSRYLIVSDDVEAKAGRKKHVPWLFAMDVNGNLDTQPVVIEGIDELNDPESICEGPSGTFFLTTSHSPNLKGHVPSSRKRLLLLALAGRTLRVIGEVDLLQTRQEAGGALALVAQSSGINTIDVEAIAYHDNALLVGLKAPLTREGKATILRLADPVNALRSHHIPAGALSVWNTLSLCLPGRVPQVCEGISDLAFGLSGTIYLLANAPKGMPTDGGGALWRVASGQGPQLLDHFEHAKPEGISLSPDGSKAVIVFDCDREVPAWVSWALSP